MKRYLDQIHLPVQFYSGDGPKQTCHYMLPHYLLQSHTMKSYYHMNLS
ncbi:hypothetical protein DFR33_102385 [Bradymonas sediminis]|nr:hypothetical protein DFR33_102385 [Bradymonas sediminis]